MRFFLVFYCFLFVLFYFCSKQNQLFANYLWMSGKKWWKVDRKDCRNVKHRNKSYLGKGRRGLEYLIVQGGKRGLTYDWELVFGRRMLLRARNVICPLITMNYSAYVGALFVHASVHVGSRKCRCTSRSLY